MSDESTLNHAFIHPCLKCGACCAFFRVSFHWSETLPESFHVPVGMTNAISNHQVAMQGTENTPIRCVALKGIPGNSVACSIYENRSSTCRVFKPSYEDGFPNQACDIARTSIQLPPLSRKNWPPVLSG